MRDKYFLLGLFIGALVAAAFLYAVYFSSAKLPLNSAFSLTAQAQIESLTYLPRYPIRNWAIADPQLETSAEVVFYPKKNKVLWAKNQNTALPVASLTKLVTAVVALENLNLNDTLKASAGALATEGEIPGFFVGEKLKVKHLLKALLIESSNDAAAILAEGIGQQKTVRLMNQKARDWDLAKTRFVEPSGLNPDNLSTAIELVRIGLKAYQNEFIKNTLAQGSFSFISDSGVFHQVVTTNQILGLPLITGGKTGYLVQSGENLISWIKLPTGDRLIIVVLGAQDRFKATLKLIDWVQKAYLWR